MKIFFYTLGCKVNQYETEVFRELLNADGFEITASEETADIFVINSCTVTAESSRKTRQAVRRFKNLNPDGITLLTGCMPQAFPEEAEKLTEADIVTGNTDAAAIPVLIKEYLKHGKRITDIKKHAKEEKFNTPSIRNFSERTRAYMKIEDGCENYCTYCIIPFARGKVRSKSLESIRQEAESLAESGFSEVVLVGINLTSYGSDTGSSLYEAVKTVGEVKGIKRIRLGSLEPDKMTDELLENLAKTDKFCPQFHLSLQSGCTATLKRMNRHYDALFYENLVNKIRSLFENSAVTTDIMVGFAGETEEEFRESLDFAKKIKFAKSHIFAYSRREGTVAAALPDQLTAAEKDRRSKLMTEVTNETEREFLQAQTGKVFPVLFENSDSNFTYGHTENYTRVKVDKNTDLQGKILNVKLLKVTEDTVYGEIV